MSNSQRLETGSTPPNFTLPSDSGTPVSLSDFSGQRVVVYFYPKAMTPGCTKEACDFRDNLEALNDLGIAVVGISPDPVARLAAFKEKHQLNFPLLSDEDKSVMKAWGAYGEKKNYGKIVQGVIRSTFLVEKDGKLGLAKYNIRASGHVGRLLGELGKN